jgi:hypothetical protein
MNILNKKVVLITLGTADIAVASHVLYRAQVLRFQPFHYHQPSNGI